MAHIIYQKVSYSRLGFCMASGHNVNYQNVVRSLIFLLFAFALSAGSFAAQTQNPDEYFFDATFGDFTEELDNAREQGKKGVFIFFEMDECPFCHWMKTNVLNQKKVQE